MTWRCGLTWLSGAMHCLVYAAWVLVCLSGHLWPLPRPLIGCLFMVGGEGWWIVPLTQKVGCEVVVGVWWNVINVIVCLLVSTRLCCTIYIALPLVGKNFLGKRMVLLWVPFQLRVHWVYQMHTFCSSCHTPAADMIVFCLMDVFLCSLQGHLCSSKYLLSVVPKI